MSLYFDTIVQFKESSAITTNCIWHPNDGLLAVASYSQERGGFIGIFDEQGEPLSDAEPPSHPVSQATSLAWRPEKRFLVTGWEDGTIRTWSAGVPGFATVPAPHTSSVMILGFSEKGARLVSADSSGNMVGWKVDPQNGLFIIFHHDFKEAITHLAFRLSIKTKAQCDIENLAKAAVNGDENALDMLSNWRPKTAATRAGGAGIMTTNDNPCFYIATQTGIVYFVNTSGNCTEVLNTEGQALIGMLYHFSRDIIIIMTEGLSIGHFVVDDNGFLTEIVKIKLSGKSQAFRGANSQGLCWAGDTLLAILTGDMIVRIWDIITNDNFTLSLQLDSQPNAKHLQLDNQVFTCMSFCRLSNILCAGTNLGQIYFWEFTRNQTRSLDEFYPSNGFNGDYNEKQWRLKHVNAIKGSVKQLQWGNIDQLLPLLSVNCITKVLILKEQELNAYYGNQVWAVQTTAYDVNLYANFVHFALKCDLQVQGISLTPDHCGVTNGKLVVVYELIWSDNTKAGDVETVQICMENSPTNHVIDANQINAFACDCNKLLIFNDKVVVLTNSGVQVRAFNGKVIASIAILQSEGEVIGMHLNNSFLVVFTMNGFIKLYNLAMDPAKWSVASKDITQILDDFGEVILAKTNVNGTKIAFTVATVNLMPDQIVYFYDVETDRVQILNIFTSSETAKANELDDIKPADVIGSETNIAICKSRIPYDFAWDTFDERLIVCAARKMPTKDAKSHFQKKDHEHVTVTMFISEEKLIVKEITQLDKDHRLIGFSTPYIAILTNQKIDRRLLSDFNGIDNLDGDSRRALLNFSYHLSLGQIDEAIQAIRLLPSKSNAWHNLAKVCVETGRVDVARICLGHMGAAREARAMRLVDEDPTLESDAVLAQLAIQLGMLEKAEELYKQCNRYDLLNKMYQAQGAFEKATEIAAKYDRINVRNTAYEWARAAEFVGDYRTAIKKYEEAGCHRENVPRLLLDKPKELEEYIKRSNDREMLKWWGQYLESLGETDQALHAYETAQDYFSQVRVLCFVKQDIDRAAQIASKSGDRAASFHMGRYYETNENVDKAVMFFVKAQAYGNAIRLCKEHNLTDDMWNIAPMASKRDKMECAKYFEHLGEKDKAILLYHQAGMVHKALDLAFKAKKYDTLQVIATNLDRDSDPVLIQKCARYFIENEHFEKAVDLLAIGKHYIDAMKLCLKHNVQLSESLAEKLTPEKDELDDTTRNDVLEKLGETLQVQGNYHLAAKKYTQSGNKINAMKALLKSGDTEKIVFFANVSRQKEIYIMAANYLQSLDWQNDPAILRNIITFYSKGKALELLANFYVACAQIEIDEFQNYDKALGALTEASRAISKVTTPENPSVHMRATEIINGQMAATKRFVDVKKLFERGDFSAGLNQSRNLLASGDMNVEKYIRKGDIYATIIQYALTANELTEVKRYLAELKQYLKDSGTNFNLSYFLSDDLMNNLAKSLGVPLQTLMPEKRSNSLVDDGPVEEIQEEI